MIGILTTPTHQLRTGDRVWFYGEKLPYTVQAWDTNGRWVIATKPFAARRTVIYTVLDMVNNVRGRDDHYGLGYETQRACLRALAYFRTGRAEHSHRHPPIPLEFVRHEPVQKGDGA